MRESRFSLHVGKRGSRQQLAADVLEEPVIFLRFGDHRDPSGIGEKGRPRPSFVENWLSQSQSTQQLRNGLPGDAF
jgi:hypothetical protein